MSISTSFYFLNGNDPKFLAAKNGTPEEQENWTDNYGPFDIRPGADLEIEEFDVVEETEEEYGGWLIPVDKIPKNCTHILISRG